MLLLSNAWTPAAAAQEPSPPAATPSSFAIFLRGTRIGGEEVNVRRTEEGWTISGSGRLGPPLDLTTRRVEVKYDREWRPSALAIDAVSKGATLSVRTTFRGGVADNEVMQAGVQTRKSDQVAADTIVLPNLFFGLYEALALRLADTAVDTVLRVYVAPQAEIAVTVRGRDERKVETAKRLIAVRSYQLEFQNPGSPLGIELWTDEDGRLLRFDVAAQGLSVVRDDLASVSARSQAITRAGDQVVRIPGNGFSLAGTLSQPAGRAPEGSRGRFPAIVLVAGSGPTDRDETVAGIPVFGQLAGHLADAGFYVLRYDKRGVGQSGGRTETATLDDFAGDVLAAVRFLRERDDVDDDRVAVFGHSEGAWVALLAASREKDIAAVVMAAGASGTGGELVLEQQRHLLARMSLSDAERENRVALQNRIQAAVLGEGTWDDVPETLRKQADTPWFRSFLGFTPRQIMSKVRQPILILQGDLDTQVPLHHADRLMALAAERKKDRTVHDEVVKLDGINHLLVPAKTGEVEEYAQLPFAKVDERVAEKTVAWLRKAMADR